MLVREVMSTHLETITPATTVQECAKKMSQLDVGVLPVWQGGQPVGLITDRDICCRAIGAGKDPAKTPVRAIMTGVMTSCFEDGLQGCGPPDEGERRAAIDGCRPKAGNGRGSLGR